MGVGSVDIDLSVNTAAFVRSVESSLAAVDGAIDLSGSTVGLVAEVESALESIGAEVDLAIDEQSRARLLADAAKLTASIPDAEIDIGASASALAGLIGELSTTIDAAEASVDAIDIPLDLAESDIPGISAALAAAVESIEATAPEISLDVGVDNSSVAATAGAFGASGAWKTAGLAAGAAFGGALLGTGAAVGFAAKAASDLGEAINKTNVIFDQGADNVQEFADGAAEIGQSTVQALDAASRFGTFGKAAGLAGDDLAGFSTDLASLASDIASFNNVDPAEAIEVLGSALAGETEPIRRFGVLLSEAEVKNQAYKAGIAESGAKLTEQQKVLARYSAILAQTGDAQGDFARTLEESGPNQLRVLKAEFTNTASAAGTALLPALLSAAKAFLPLVSTLADQVAPAFEALAPVIEDIAPLVGDLAGDLVGAIVGILPGFGRLVVSVLELGSAFAPVLKVVAAVAGAFAEAVTPLVDFLAPVAPIIAAVAGFAALGGTAGIIGGVASAIGALGAAFAFIVANPVVLGIAAIAGAFILAYKNIGPFREAIQSVGEFITDTALPAIQAFASFVGDKLGAAFDAVKVGDFASAFGQLSDIGTVIVDGLGNALTAIGSWLTGTVFPFLTANAPGWISALLGWLVDAAVFIVPKLGQFLLSIGTWIVGTALPFLAAKAAELAGALIGFAGQAVALIPGALGALLGAIGGFVTGTLLPAVGTLFTEVIPFALGWIAGAAIRLPFELAKLWLGVQGWVLFDLIPGIVGWVAGAVPAFLGWVWDTAKRLPGALETAAEKISGFLTSLPDKIVGWVGNAADWLVDAGGDVIRGLWNGIADMDQWINDRIGEFAGSVVRGFKSAIGIDSPSTVMADEVGRWIPPGLAQGITGAAAVAIAAASALSADVVAAAAVDAPPVAIPVELGTPDLSVLDAIEAQAVSVPVSAQLGATAIAGDQDQTGIVKIERPVEITVDRKVLGRVVTDELIEIRRGRG